MSTIDTGLVMSTTQLGQQLGLGSQTREPKSHPSEGLGFWALGGFGVLGVLGFWGFGVLVGGFRGLGVWGVRV